MKKCIAVTGGIGSGKSAVLQIIKNMGYSVFSCDEIYKEICKDKEYVGKIGKTFDGVVKDGNIDRIALGKTVFADEAARKRLDEIAHPRIMTRLFEKMRSCEDDRVFAEVPLLFEGGFEGRFDGVLVVLREKEDRVEAICQRDGVDKNTALTKMSSQFNYDADKNKSKLATSNLFLIQNKGSIEELRLKVEKAVNYFDGL